MDQFKNQAHPLYASARLWDDGIIDPTKTRDILSASLRITSNQKIEDIAEVHSHPIALLQCADFFNESKSK